MFFLYTFSMSKQKSIYICESCGAESSVWGGQCRFCGEWNTLVEKVVSESVGKVNTSISIKPRKLKNIASKELMRLSTGISEFDRALGGGLVPGQVVLIAGTPGVGKSTLLLQLSEHFKGNVLYASGEESENQIALRASRLGVKNESIDIASSGNIDSILSSFSHDLLIVDSIQAVQTTDLKSQIGSMSQIKECANRVVSVAKREHKPAVIVGHITKDGEIAGPKVLEHIVDTVLYLDGDKRHMFRMLRVHKNRFGDASEVGMFKMEESGLVDVENPSELFMSDTLDLIPGSVTTVILEGTRPLTIEVQALTTKTSFGFPKRASSGYSLNRLQLLCAVIQKHLHVDLLNQDVYLNIVSGLQTKDPAVDLAVISAILSSFYEKSIAKDIAFFGEVGLGGEVRAVTAQKRRIKEAKKLGYKNVYSSDNIKSIRTIATKIKNS